MAGILSGLAGLGLNNLENMEIYEKPKSDTAEQKVVAKLEEKDLIYDKTFSCPVCGKNFSSKIMKSGKAKLIGTDPDLRPRYDGIDMAKYEVEMCPNCGYSALSRFFTGLSGGQIKLIQEHISSKVQLHPHGGETYTYEEAMERYKLALACAVVKRARASEKAYICLKSGWLLRGYAEYQKENGLDNPSPESLKEEEDEYLLNAYNGFVEARQNESFPMCGMDEVTIDFLLAELAYRFKKYDVASRMVASILTSVSANARTKDKARDLKDRILADLKKKQ